LLRMCTHGQARPAAWKAIIMITDVSIIAVPG
jgi:hypothetical protein